MPEMTAGEYYLVEMQCSEALIIVRIQQLRRLKRNNDALVCLVDRLPIDRDLVAGSKRHPQLLRQVISISLS